MEEERDTTQKRAYPRRCTVHIQFCLLLCVCSSLLCPALSQYNSILFRRAHFFIIFFLFPFMRLSPNSLRLWISPKSIHSSTGQTHAHICQ
ncbi:MAG: hypothetical protein JOS17DRAFT_754518 [Linnemannia elongata]|nr:MAG: hypothetical protein JOS17DRAFT_754518 [Linnemannia elongata]